MLNVIRRLVRDEEGQSMVEYGLIIVLIALAIFTALELVGTNLDLLFEDIAEKLEL